MKPNKYYNQMFLIPWLKKVKEEGNREVSGGGGGEGEEIEQQRFGELQDNFR